MQISLAIVLVVLSGLLIGVYVFADNNTTIINNSSVNSEIVVPMTNGDTTTPRAEILVRFNPDLWNTTVLQVASNASHTSIGSIVLNDYSSDLPGLELVLLPENMTAEEGIAYYQKLPYVQYAEKNAEYSIEQTKNLTITSEGNNTISKETPVNSSEPARLLIQFNTSAFSDLTKLSQSANEVHALINATHITDYSNQGLPGLFLVSLPVNMTVKEGISFYKNQTDVLFVEPDYKISI